MVYVERLRLYEAIGGRVGGGEEALICNMAGADQYAIGRREVERETVCAFKRLELVMARFPFKMRADDLRCDLALSLQHYTFGNNASFN